jgi:hypothetical protein
MGSRLAVALVMVGCAPSGGINLTLSVAPTVSDATLSRVLSLEIAASGAQNADTTYPLAGLAREERVVLRSSLSAGALDITATASDSDGLTVLTGNTQAMLEIARGSAGITLDLPSLVVTPSAAGVTINRAQRFTANLPVTWSVDEPNAGSIDADGTYHAPATAGGPYHVRATRQAAPDVSQSVPINVMAYGVELFAGAFGGPGLAPGTGATARVNSVAGLAAAGNDLYLADAIGTVIHHIDPAGNLTQIVGQPYSPSNIDGSPPTASIGWVDAIAVDTIRNQLYLGAAGGLRQVDLATSTMTTVPVNSSGVLTIAGLWFDGNHTLYIAEHTDVISSYDVTTGIYTILAGVPFQSGFADGDGNTARFSRPSGITGDGTYLYVSDRGNLRIRKIALSPSIMVTTLAGTGASGCNDDVGSAATFASPRGVWVIPGDTRLFVTDGAPNNVIRNVATDTGSTGTVFGKCGVAGHLDGGAAVAEFSNPLSIVSLANDTIYIGEESSGTLRSYFTTTVNTPFGTVANTGSIDGPASSARFSATTDVVADGDRVFVADTANNCVRVVDANGVVSRLVGVPGDAGNVDGDATTARLRAPVSLAWDGAVRRLYILDAVAMTLRGWDDAAGSLTTLVGHDGDTSATDGKLNEATFNSPKGMALDDTGRVLFVGDLFGGVVRRISLDTGVTTVAGSRTAFGYTDGPLGTSLLWNAVAFGWTPGVLWIGDGSRLRAWQSSTGLVTSLVNTPNTPGFVDGSANAARFRQITSMHASAGRLWMTDSASLRWLDLATLEVGTLAGDGQRAVIAAGPLPSTLNSPTGIAVLSSGDLVVGDAYEPALTRVRFAPP